MDPSEFEGTVERETEVASAGVLENLLTTADLPKFQCLDLLKESQDIYLSIYNLQDVLNQKEKHNPLHNDVIIQEMEEASNKVIELKEEYLTRRQQLKQQVKEYLTHLPHHIQKQEVEEESSNSPPNEKLIEFSQESEKIVTEFKLEYDFLVNMNKFLENNFLKLITNIQDLPDYHTTVQDALQICLKSQEIIKNAQEQLNYAEKIIHSYSSYSPGSNEGNGGNGGSGLPSISKILHFIANHEKSSSSSSLHLDFTSRDHSTHNNNTNNNNTHTAGGGSNHHPSENQHNIEDLQEYYQIEINSMQQKYELEMKNQTHRQFLQFQEKELQLTQRLENIIHQKEDEILQYMNLINQYENKLQLLKEQEKMIEIEKEKKNHMEEKCRSQLLMISDVNNQLMQKNQSYLEMQNQFNELNNSTQQYRLTMEEKVKEMERQGHEQTAQIAQYQQLFLLLPKEEEIQQFAKEIGFYEEDNDDDEDDSNDDKDDRDNHKDKESHDAREDSYDWNDDNNDNDKGNNNNKRKRKGRKNKEHRRKKDPIISRLTWHQLEQFIQQTMRRLNNDVIAYRLQDSEWSRKYQTIESQHQQLMKASENYQMQIKLLENEIKYSQAPSISMMPSPVPSNTTINNNNNTSNSSTTLPNHSFIDLELNNLLQSAASTATPLSSNPPTNKKGEGNAGQTPAANEEYVSILQQQRNHYMKQTEQLQKELQLYKNLVTKLEDEKEHLTNENMELYRRLRVLRVMNSGSGSGGAGSSSLHLQEVRSRRHDYNSDDVAGGGGGGRGSGGVGGGGGGDVDQIDQKYHQLYEHNDLNPYKILELEKKQYVASLNILERTIIAIYHFFMKDANLRYVFLIYLLFIHFLSFLYMFQILNPQLAEEVDMHMKNKWSMETLSMAEHPDLME